MDVAVAMSVIRQMCAIFLFFLSSYSHLQTSDVKIINYKKYIFGKSYERTLVSKFAILDQKWSKVAQQNKLDLLIFANHPAVHSGGVSRGGVRGCSFWR